MYFAPLPHKCQKCGHEMEISESERQHVPYTSRNNPVCSKCWGNFIDNLGIEMLCTVDFHKGGSEYDKAVKTCRSFAPDVAPMNVDEIYRIMG